MSNQRSVTKRRRAAAGARPLRHAAADRAAGGDARAAAYVECAVGDRVLWGVGLHDSIVKASLRAILSAVNRAERDAAQD